jgi:hypothetical protein
VAIRARSRSCMLHHDRVGDDRGAQDDVARPVEKKPSEEIEMPTRNVADCAKLARLVRRRQATALDLIVDAVFVDSVKVSL